MRGRGKHTTCATFVTALGVLATVVLSGSAGAQGPMVIPPAPSVEFAFDAYFSPGSLSKTEPTPIALGLSGQIKTADGTHPPALREFVLEADRNSAIDVKGLPICRPRQREERSVSWEYEVCKDMIVGRGTMDVEVAFPEQQPLQIKSALTIFNGGVKQGVTTLFAYTYFKKPVSAAVVSRVEIKKIHKGRYGTKATISVPVIAGGSGSVTAFAATLFRRFSYKGKRASLVTLKCPDGKIQAQAEAIFSDGMHAHAQVLRACTPKG